MISPMRRIFVVPTRATALALALGAILLVGGPARIAGPSYTAVRTYGGSIVWGVGFLALAMILLVTATWLSKLLPAAFFIAACGYTLFAIACLTAAIEVPTAGLTGIVTYTWVAYLHLNAAWDAHDGRPFR